MKTFQINNEFELGNAIWAAKEGDTIVLNKGKYGIIPIKYGVNYEFIDSACSRLIGLEGIFDIDGSSAGLIVFNGIKIQNPRIDKSNIKMYHVFRTKLPFNSRFENPINFSHPNGAIISIIGNDKESLQLGGFGLKAEDQLPKAIVDIYVPSLEAYDFKFKNEYRAFNHLSPNPINLEPKAEQELEEVNLKIEEIENTSLNSSIGLHLNNFEYKALWALKTFIKEYCRLFEESKIKGYSVNEFKDGLLFGILENADDVIQLTSKSFVGKYNSINLSNDDIIKLSTNFLSFEEYSISEYTSYHLNHLNYSFATIGMYQEFEAFWENTNPAIYNLSNPNEKNKWKFIEYITIDLDTKKYLAEMVNARNWIIHTKKIITKEDSRNKLKTDWFAEVLNEYQIYALKRPFYWHKALNDFKIEFNKKSNSK